MYLYVLRFHVFNKKLYEFNLALGRLVKWPVYVLRQNNDQAEYRTFELVRTWQNKGQMNHDLKSTEYGNLIGAIRVLGEITESNIYSTIHESNLLEEDEYTF
ncbi:hypothetical protein [Robiginitalea aurantiaca]|uniref:Uncharacterized protein n=1 Tax=Robiginitalea aurantiaca TaxID=3056915 RepID=A0ABT7WIG5_9FLAO|nr:hypothetical protein [Robiginitalea aurantiaca]MDM9632718.1 hypothetical protein [Robiginitalea aurantiaca]